MDRLNYHHLRYFWIVAREGSISRACELLDLAQPTISHQVRELEEALGHKLFSRVGRNIVLTEQGKTVFSYATEIFALGRELLHAVNGNGTSTPRQLNVGISDVLPKRMAFRLLEAVLQLPDSVHLQCREGKMDRLLADLAVHQHDVVLTDAPVQPVVKVRAFNHLLGECGVSFFGTQELAEKYRPCFPASLNAAPILLPMEDSTLRRDLDRWLHSRKLRPTVRGVFSESTMLRLFGNHGLGLFVLPSVLEKDVLATPGIELIGRTDDIRSRCYAITIGKKLKHPAVVAISEAARKTVYV